MEFTYNDKVKWEWNPLTDEEVDRIARDILAGDIGEREHERMRRDCLAGKEKSPFAALHNCTDPNEFLAQRLPDPRPCVDADGEFVMTCAEYFATAEEQDEREETDPPCGCPPELSPENLDRLKGARPCARKKKTG